MDKSAMGHDFIAKVDKHDSQKDYKTGFGGKFGVQTDRVDKSALGWEHVEKVGKHNSQQGGWSGGACVSQCLTLSVTLSHRLQGWVWWKVWCPDRQAGQVCAGLGPY